MSECDFRCFCIGYLGFEPSTFDLRTVREIAGKRNVSVLDGERLDFCSVKTFSEQILRQYSVRERQLMRTREMFDALDVESKGFISLSNFASIASALSLSAFLSRRCDVVFADLDPESTGKVTFEMFKTMIDSTRAHETSLSIQEWKCA